MSRTISRTDLARHTREAIESAQRGEAVFIESYGAEQAALVDAREYHLLRAVAIYRSRPRAPSAMDGAKPRGLTEDEVRSRVATEAGDWQAAWDAVIAAYLDGDVSLGRAALLLGISRFDLQGHFNRIGMSIVHGARSLHEARDEYDSLGTEAGH